MIAAGSGYGIFLIIVAVVAGVLLLCGATLAIFGGANSNCSRAEFRKGNLIGATSATCPRYMLLMGLLLLIGILNVNTLNQKQSFAESANGTTCQILGKIIEIKEGTTYNQIWLRTSSIAGDDVSYEGSNKIIYYTTDSVDDYYLGQQILVDGTVSMPDLPTNPGEFNSRTYYRNKGVYLVVWTGSVTMVETKKNTLANFLRNIRKQIQEVYDTVFTETEASIVKAMLLGVKENMDKETKRLYQLNGIAHVLAISGVHIAIIGMWVYKRLRKILGSYWISGILAIILVVLYGIMTGLASSTARAVAMLAINLVGNALGRSSDMMTSAGITCIIMAFINPFIVLDAGFQLSFAAVLGIAIVNPALKDIFGKGGKLRQAIFVSLSATVGTLPIIIYNYYQFPLYSIFLNLIVVPLVSVIIFASLVTGLVGLINITLASYCAVPVKVILALYEKLCTLMEKIPYYNINTGHISVAMIFAYYAFVLLLLLMLFRYRKWFIKVACFLLLAGGIYMAYLNLDTSFKVVFLDVGQGDGILVKTESGTNILIDGGSSSNSSLGEYVLMPAIKYYGMCDLDYVFVSHGDSDHISGIEYLLEALHTGITIKNLVVPLYGDMDALDDLIIAASDYGANIIYMDAGDTFSDGDGFVLTALYPDKYLEYTDANNSSLMLKIEYGGYSFLFTGDAGSEEEEAGILLEDVDISADVLKVGHHGSKYSSSEEFLAAVSPTVAVISVGANNSYGHPTEEALSRLADVGATIYRTDTMGAVIFGLTDMGLAVTKFGESGG